ncbi:MAG TPA: hypothetical protein VGW38_10235 [Chloroflexota bacterium]|nr:hypothetical protein [Chloroflexota bacterium]
MRHKWWNTCDRRPDHSGETGPVTSSTGDRKNGHADTLVAYGRCLGLGTGEVVEVLERLPPGRHGNGAFDQPRFSATARAALERYAARKRAVRRLAERGRL